MYHIEKYIVVDIFCIAMRSMYGRFGYSKKHKKSRLMFENDESAPFLTSRSCRSLLCEGMWISRKTYQRLPQNATSFRGHQGEKNYDYPKNQVLLSIGKSTIPQNDTFRGQTSSTHAISLYFRILIERSEQLIKTTIGSFFQRKAANIHRKNVCAKWAKNLDSLQILPTTVDGSEILLTSWGW